MGRFITSADLKPDTDGETWTLDADLVYTSEASETITVPRGFVTDLASIPRLFWNILPPFGRWSLPSIVHDYLYRNHIGTRKHADDIFLEGMKDCGVGWLSRMTIYWNVRAFGWNAWNNEKELHAKPY